MGQPYIEIQLTSQTVAGDSFSFFANGEYFTFTCVNDEAQIPRLFEYDDTDGGTVSGTAGEIANSLKKALPSTYEVIIDDVLILIRPFQGDQPFYNFGTVVIDNSNGSNLELVTQVDSDGTVIFEDGVSTGNISDQIGVVKINSIKFENLDLYPSLQTDFLFGNIGDVVNATINFDVIDVFGSLEFKYGLIENSTDPITRDPSTQRKTIDATYFQSLFSSDNQSFIGDTTGMSPRNPKSWQTEETNLSLSDIGGGNYELVHTFKIQPLIRIDDVINGVLSIPDDFNGGRSLKYVFEINTKESEANPKILGNSTAINASGFFKTGNVGFIGEFGNGNPSKYGLQSFQWLNDNNEINYTITTNGIGQLKSLFGSPFTSSTRLIVNIQATNNSISQSSNVDETVNLGRVELLADGTIVTPPAGSPVINVQASIEPLDDTLINFDINIAAFSYLSDYTFFITVSNDDLNFNHNNIEIRTGSASAGIDTSDLLLSNYPGSDVENITILPHYRSDVIDAYNNMVQVVGDYMPTKWRLIDNSTDKTITKFVISLKSELTGQTFQSNEINPDQINSASNNLILDTGFILSDSDPRNVFAVRKAGNEYEFEYLFQLYETQIEEEDLVISFSVIGTSTLQTGETFPFNKEWQPSILGYINNEFPDDFTNISSYDESRTEETLDDPSYLIKELNFYEIGGSEKLDGLIRDGVTKIEAIFKPDPTVLVTPPEASRLVGYLGVIPCSGGQNQSRQFHTIFSPEANSPFEDNDDSGLTTNATIELDVLTNEILLKGNIRWSKLKSLYPNNDQFKVFARPDIIQVFPQPMVEETHIEFRNNANNDVQFPYDVESDNHNIIADILGLQLSDLSFFINAVSYPDSSAFITALNGFNGNTVTIRLINNNTSVTESGLILQQIKNTPVSQRMLFNFQSPITTLKDELVWFNTKIQLQNFIKSSAISREVFSIRQNGPDLEDWTVFDYNDISSDLALINNELSAINEGDFYALHIGTSAPAQSGVELSFDVVYDNANKFFDTQVDIRTQTNYGFANSLVLDSIPANPLTNVQITGDTNLLNLMSSDALTPFTICCWYLHSSSGAPQRVFILSTTNRNKVYIQTISDTLEVSIGNATRIFDGIRLDDRTLITIQYDGGGSILGVKAFANAIPLNIRSTTGDIHNNTPPDTVLYFHRITNNGTTNNTTKIERCLVYDRLLNGEEIRRMNRDLSFIPSGIFRYYDGSVPSPIQANNILYERINDQAFALINGNYNRSAF